MGDPYERPPGYKPPESAWQLLERYAKGERYFDEASLSSASLSGADLSKAHLVNAHLSGASLRSVNLTRADLTGAHLADADLSGANLTLAYLAAADLHGASLSGVQLTDANLYGADLTRTNLYGANVRGANLTRTNLRGANLTRADLTGADLSDADLSGADLSFANLCSAAFGGAKLAFTNLTGVDLAGLCQASPGVVHEGPSTVEHRSILLSVRALHLRAFLVRAGVPETLADYTIEFAKSVEGSVFMMMCSTFISYGAPDEIFARKLYEALHKSGVTTFLFSEHAEPGERLHRLMRRGVNEHDRVLLVCSRASLDRKGVLNELEETLAREARDGGETYLIPIRLDDYVFNGWKPKRADIAQAVRDRVVADFEGADADDGKFNRELGKLLRALRKPSPAGAGGAGGP